MAALALFDAMSVALTPAAIAAIVKSIGEQLLATTVAHAVNVKVSGSLPSHSRVNVEVPVFVTEQTILKFGCKYLIFDLDKSDAKRAELIKRKINSTFNFFIIVIVFKVQIFLK